ncbi:hypothetical protein M409DRAFT_25448 [Zasmidium cellare ATCC 36951]|uniref:Uncharacterized protein n=1 Tax=Zasmidium cellare ATCC 36951 TaxID=1080233 RepID=A0A6A6CAM1_ZASCE|nr:uncharacterized protein M409DRAFT_25448 [Zasmidium cellare ATCC 36951]KAF2164101.1 hypothetical protein M409DRAFT_25448 [Zasmidium cellare ATCC 36951]
MASSNSSMDSQGDLRRADGRDSATQPEAASISSDSVSAVHSSAKVALPVSESSSLRQVWDNAGTRDAASVRSSLGLGVAPTATGTQGSGTELNTAANLHLPPSDPTASRTHGSDVGLDSAANVDLPASESSSLRQLQEHTRMGDVASVQSTFELGVAPTASRTYGFNIWLDSAASLGLPASESSSLRLVREHTGMGDADFAQPALALDVALPPSEASSLRRTQGHTAIERPADDTASVHSSFIGDVALLVPATSSLQQLQDQQGHVSNASHASSKHSTSALNVALPASTSSSLQALVQLASKTSAAPASGPQEWTSPLPPSQSNSVASANTVGSFVSSVDNGIPLDTLNLSSLDQLQNAATSSHADWSQQHAHAGNFPLPDSRSGSNAAASDPAEGDPVSYADLIQPLIHCMPHLSSLNWSNWECRNMNAGAVFGFDFYGTLTDYKGRIVKEGNESWLGDQEAWRLLTEQPAKDITSKLIIAEDLSPDTIDVLGSAFHIDPEAFALQLSRGRFSNKVHAKDDHDGRWNTCGMATSKASIQWYRPVRLDAGAAAWLKDPEKLDQLLDVASGDKEGEEEEDVCLSWSQKIVTCWKRGQGRMYGNSGPSRFVSQKDIYHRARITSNIFRRSRLLSTKVAKASKKSVPCAWEEKATIFRVEDAHVPTLILLVDPMPTITDSHTVTETRLRLNPVPTKVKRDPIVKEVDLTIFLPSRVRGPLQLPANKLNISEDELQHLEQASWATSTAAAVESWLSVMHDQTNPVLALLEVVRLDSIAFFDSLDTCLKEISEDSIDDYLMTRRLADWRQLLNDFESKAAEIGQSLHEFIDFAFNDPNDRPARVEEIIEELDSRTQRFSQRIEKAYAALRAEMGLFESRRSIAEAETVTKLTELAFVFIPLTFCCGLFSMQVNELQNGVPLRTFIITALIVFVICYGARTIMRSSIIVESMQSAQESLWAAKALKRGGLASTFLIFLFVGSFTAVPVAFLWTNVHLGSALNVLIMLLLVPIGIAVAWTCATAYTDVRSTSAENKVPLELRIALWVSGAIISRRVNASTSEFPSDFASPNDSGYGDV